jgi:hypothetical protein
MVGFATPEFIALSKKCCHTEPTWIPMLHLSSVPISLSVLNADAARWLELKAGCMMSLSW